MDNLKWAIEFCVQLARVTNVDLNELIDKVKSIWETAELMESIWED